MPVSSSSPSNHTQVSPGPKPSGPTNATEGSRGGFQAVFEENAASHPHPSSPTRDSTKAVKPSGGATVSDTKANPSQPKSNKSAPPSTEVSVALAAQMASLAAPPPPLVERATPQVGTISTVRADPSVVGGQRSFAGRQTTSGPSTSPNRGVALLSVIKESSSPSPDPVPLEAPSSVVNKTGLAQSGAKATAAFLVAGSVARAEAVLGVTPPTGDPLDPPTSHFGVVDTGQTQAVHDAPLVTSHGQSATVVQDVATKGPHGEGSGGNVSMANPYLVALAAQPPVSSVLHGGAQVIELARAGGSVNVIREPQEMVQVIGAHLSSNPNLPSLLHLKVTPEGMGTLDIHIEATASGLHIKLETSSSALGNSLAGSLTDLKEQMKTALGTNVNLEMGLGGSFNQPRSAEGFAKSSTPQSSARAPVIGGLDHPSGTAEKSLNRLVDVLA